MKYYKNSDGDIFAIEEDCQNFLIKPDWIPLTQTEVDVHRNLAPPEYLCAISERLWRNSELSRADNELNKVQDSDPKMIHGISEWRSYRKELRAWPEHEGFPKKEFRPKAPDLQE